MRSHGAKSCSISPIGLRINSLKGDGRLPNVQIEEAFQTGQFEIQDEGSQLVSLLVDAKADEMVMDFCAGGGGKSLAMAAEMNNQGQIFAFDVDKRRLAPPVSYTHLTLPTIYSV